MGVALLQFPPDAQSGVHVTFTAGDTVVHPRHGVANVVAIATRGTGKARRKFLELGFADGSLRILVPVDAVDEVWFRRLPTKREAEEILTVLAGESEVPEAWAERTALTASRMKSTELVQASMVVRDLTRHAQRPGKPLSGFENASLQKCLRSVASELSRALEISEDEAEALILETARSESVAPG